MADVNNSGRKRKSSTNEIIFEVKDNVALPVQLPIIENIEPNPKVARKEETMENTDSNLYQDLSQNSVETNISVQEKIMELQDENMKLKRQLQDLTSKFCKCSLEFGPKETTKDTVDGQDDILISIKFINECVANAYKHKFKMFIETFVEFAHSEDNLIINIAKNDQASLTNTNTTLQDANKHKRKRKKSKSVPDLFVLDTTPSITTKENRELKYTSKYSFIDTEKKEAKCVLLQTCFNCDKNHALRDCPQPKNFVKINAARIKMKSQQITKARYHLDEDQKYAHMKPGNISQQLRDALGLRSNDLPPYIYRMRAYGYPPGWMEDAKVLHSNMAVFDMEGKDFENKKKISSLEYDQVIQYPGFNVPMEKGVKDNYKQFNCPQYSEKCSINAMLEFIRRSESTDSDLESRVPHVPTKEEILAPPGCEAENSSNEKVNLNGRISPSLNDLEKKKLELLAALEDNSTSGSGIDEIKALDDIQSCEINKNVQVNTNINDVQILQSNEVNEGKQAEESESEQAVNNSDKEAITEATQIENLPEINDNTRKTEAETNNDAQKNRTDSQEINDVSNESQNDTPQTPNDAESVKLKQSSFGTPIVKGASPYNRLPHPNNFSKDISPVINFENLPNSTGKYEQMVNVLQKVRSTLKNINGNS